MRGVRQALLIGTFAALAGCGTPNVPQQQHHPLNGRWELIAINEVPLTGAKPLIEVSKSGSVDVVAFDSPALGEELTKDDLKRAFSDNSQPGDGIRIEKFQSGAKLVHRTQSGRLLEFRKQDG